MNNLFVDTKYLEILLNIFDEFCPQSEIFAYGSRINNCAHVGSDLDLVIKNFPPNKYLFELKEKISESNVPFLVDINIFENLPQSFQEEINKNNILIYPKS